LSCLFLFLGGRVFFVRRRNGSLVRRGTAVHTTFHHLELNTAVRINDAHPWRVVTEWIDPATGVRRQFRSENLWSDPTPHLVGNPIVVYVDPRNADHYYMDVSFPGRTDGVVRNAG
jgi:hypothetical protein